MYEERDGWTAESYVRPIRSGPVPAHRNDIAHPATRHRDQHATVREIADADPQFRALDFQRFSALQNI